MVLQGLIKIQMQIFHRERNADPDFEKDDQRVKEQINDLNQINTTNVAKKVVGEEIVNFTSDIYGKHLSHF